MNRLPSGTDPICAQDERPLPTPDRSAAHRGPIVASRAGADVIACADCKHAHLWPMPEAAELALLYERMYEENAYGDQWLDKDEREADYWRLEHQDKLAFWRKRIGRSGRLLDVGCSGGLLLDDARTAGWDVVGIEPSHLALERCRSKGLTVHDGLYQDVELAPASFDVIHARLVMEHLPDPLGFVRWAHAHLRIGGVLTVQIPNEFNALQLRARDVIGADDWWVAPPFHLNYFTFETLEALLNRGGFDVAGRDASFAVELFLLMGDDYVHDGEIGATIHGKRMRLESELERIGLRRAFHQFLAGHGLGREAIVHAVSRDHGPR